MQGSQFRKADGWVDNPLQGSLTAFMNPIISPLFGPQGIPYLSTVTVATGTGNNALAAVPTTSLPTPYMVKTLMPDDSDWVLIMGIFSGSGYITPNDQGQSGKTWKQTQ